MSHLPGFQQLSEGLTQAYQRYRLELKKFFELNARDPHAVDDLMQTMFVQLMGDRRREEVRDPRQYLFRTAWNVLHNANVRARREKNRDFPCDETALEKLADRSNALWIEDDATTALQQEELNRVLAKLPRACQVALLRQYRDDRSYKQIAAELGVTTHAVKKYIVRALNHFRRHFESMDRNDAHEGKRS